MYHSYSPLDYAAFAERQLFELELKIILHEII